MWNYGGQMSENSNIHSLRRYLNTTSITIVTMVYRHSNIFRKYIQLDLDYMVSRHTIVCRAAQGAGTPHHGYIDRKKENVILQPLYLSDTLSDWNQICCRVARELGESTFQI